MSTNDKTTIRDRAIEFVNEARWTGEKLAANLETFATEEVRLALKPRDASPELAEAERWLADEVEHHKTCGHRGECICSNAVVIAAELDRLRAALKRKGEVLRELVRERDEARIAAWPPPVAPCAACAAKAEELARLRVQFCACEAHMAELLDAERAEVTALRSRITELEAPEQRKARARKADPASEGDDGMTAVPQEVHERGWQWRHVGDGAFAPPFGTIRVCRVCGCLVAGGPTACVRCVKAEELLAAPPAQPEPFVHDGGGARGCEPEAPQGERRPCAKCGKLRTKAEGAEVFTTCEGPGYNCDGTPEAKPEPIVFGGTRLCEKCHKVGPSPCACTQPEAKVGETVEHLSNGSWHR